MTIPYSRQHIDEEDIALVANALRSSHLTQGPLLEKFEKEFADYCGAKFAVAFCNGTAALHAAVKTLNLKASDEGLVPAITFAATANCLKYEGLKVNFSDVTPGLPLMDIDKLESYFSSQTRVLIPVHFAGSCVDLPKLYPIAQKKSCYIIEDAAHAVGSSYYDENKNEWMKVGSCKHSDLCCFSFHPVKNITTAEGGMVTTNNPDYYQKLKKIRHHGIVYPNPNEKKPLWDYDIDELNYNYRMTEMQAALGLAQLKKIEIFKKEKMIHYKKYEQALKNRPDISLLPFPENSDPFLHLSIVKFKDKVLREQAFNRLRANDVFCQLHYKPLYRLSLYKSEGLALSKFSNSEDYFDTCLSVPNFVGMTGEEFEKVIELLCK